MIVNITEKGWEIFYHRAHALLAAQLASYWCVIDDQSRLLETIAAIAHHDDLEREWESEMITEAGAPLDFKLGQAMAADDKNHHILNALYRSRWVALLTSMHLCCLCTLGQGMEQEDLDSDTQEFLEEQAEQQQQWRQQLGLSKEEVETQYQFMRWCDRLSLILCQRQVPAAGRWLEILEGPEGDRHDLCQTKTGELTVRPWPFSREQFVLRADAYHIHQLKFESSEALKGALASTTATTVEWRFRQSSGST